MYSEIVYLDTKMHGFMSLNLIEERVVCTEGSIQIYLTE